MRKNLLGFVVLVSAILSGCDDNQLGTDVRHPNRPPVTTLSSGPPHGVGPGGPHEEVGGTNYRVHVFWSGSDPDGTIDHYDFILQSHSAASDSFQQVDPDANPDLLIPGVDDPRWRSTSAKDTILVTPADTLRTDPAPDPNLDVNDIPVHNAFVRLRSFERWHTFFVRAVDNEGMVDPSPQYVTFNAQTIAPSVRILPPVPRGAEFLGPRKIVFNWEGEDPVGDGSFLDPIASRWVILETNKDENGLYIGWPRRLYESGLPWSPWRAWDAPDRSGKRAVTPTLRPFRLNEPGGYYFFAVQAMDEAGAVTPVFDDATPDKNNAVRIRVDNRVGPELQLIEQFLGSYVFSSGATGAQSLDIAAGQPIRFRWLGDATSYGGEIDSYRYGWNIQNLDNDQEWDQDWCRTCRSAPARAFTSGTQRFYLEAIDNAESVTRAVVELQVHQVTRRRDLLVVDDSQHPQATEDPREPVEDARWTNVMESLVAQHPFTFNPAIDFFDINSAANLGREPPPIPLLFDYKVVVWNVVCPGNGCAFEELAEFSDPFVRRNFNRTKSFNYLSLYLDNGGKIWVNGTKPAHAIWPELEGLQGGQNPIPVNVTQWEDRLELHPQGVDSVGTLSTLYRLGVEYFDLGGSSFGTPRRSLNHFCLGLERAMPEGFEMQNFGTEVVDTGEQHSHDVSLPTEDVESEPPVGRVYTTTFSTDHEHTLDLSEADFITLRKGQQVLARTSEESTPVAHSHGVELVDQVGLWGAPVLSRNLDWWPNPMDPGGNPRGFRNDVEIYNCPGEMPNLGLAPQALVLYTYISGIKEDRDSTPTRIYPLTGDKQPSVLLAKKSPDDLYYSRAMMGVEAWLLDFDSHLRLAEFILVRHLRLGQADP